MSTYGAILGASIGVILLCLVVVVACYVLYAVSHMKALKALGYKNAWLAWIPYGVFYACADAATEGEGEKVKLFGSLELPVMVFQALVDFTGCTVIHSGKRHGRKCHHNRIKRCILRMQLC